MLTKNRSGFRKSRTATKFRYLKRRVTRWQRISPWSVVLGFMLPQPARAFDFAVEVHLVESLMPEAVGLYVGLKLYSLGKAIAPELRATITEVRRRLAKKRSRPSHNPPNLPPTG